VVAELAKKKSAPKSSKLVFSASQTPTAIDGIEVFTLVEEDDEGEQTEEFDV
jgi:hypothetical protein